MSAEEKAYREIEALLNTMADVYLGRKKGARFTFTFELTSEMERQEVELLCLSERSRNSLRRAGITTIAELARFAQDSSNLKTIRNCGSKSVAEIMEKLFLLNYCNLRPGEREKFIAETILRNGDV